jgi:predicted glycoside hydrolase/deacetylase ChbG (UPF0249 family)
VSTERSLIVNADDFGLTSGVNRGIIEAHENGIVTSASLMVRAPAASEAASYARANDRLSVGLHIDLAEWRYENGTWVAAYQVVDPADAAAIQAECERQLAEFEALLSRKPTHLDSHQHVHLSEPARGVTVQIARRVGVPLRSCSPEIAYRGDFYGQLGEGEPYHEAITVEALVSVIEKLAPRWTELGCHPGYADGLDSVYRLEREEEVRVLCSAQVKAALHRCGVHLRSFAEIRSSTRLHAG